MKILFALLALLLAVNSTPAQTLQWTYAVTPATAFPAVQPEEQQITMDGFGGACLVLDYGNGGRLVWLNHRGKVLHDEEFPDAGIYSAPRIVHAEHNFILVYLSVTGTEAHVLRRYQRRNGEVKATDLPFGNNRYPAQPFKDQDSLGFIVRELSNGSIVSVARYTFK